MGQEAVHVSWALGSFPPGLNGSLSMREKFRGDNRTATFEDIALTLAHLSFTFLAWMPATSMQHTCSGGTLQLPQQHFGRSPIHRRFSKMRTDCRAPQQEMAVQHPAELPSTYKRLVGRKTGKNFREVAEVEECDMVEPGAGQVNASWCHKQFNVVSGCTTAVQHWHRACPTIVYDGKSAAQALVRIAYAGVNGGCETFRVRGSSYTPCAHSH